MVEEISVIDIIDYTGKNPEAENLSAAEYALDVANKLSDQQEEFAKAEETRITNEANRISAEATRISAESTRISAEEARKIAEGSDDSTSQYYESGRCFNERSRQAAEGSILTQSGRAYAEKLRVEAETSRRSAEEQRTTTFRTNEGKDNQEASATGSRWQRFKYAENQRQATFNVNEGEASDAEDENGSRWARYNHEEEGRTQKFNNKLGDVTQAISDANAATGRAVAAAVAAEAASGELEGLEGTLVYEGDEVVTVPETLIVDDAVSRAQAAATNAETYKNAAASSASAASASASAASVSASQAASTLANAATKAYVDDKDGALQTELAGKVDKIAGSSLINSGVADNLGYFNDRSEEYGHIVERHISSSVNFWAKDFITSDGDTLSAKADQTDVDQKQDIKGTREYTTFVSFGSNKGIYVYFVAGRSYRIVASGVNVTTVVTPTGSGDTNAATRTYNALTSGKYIIKASSSLTKIEVTCYYVDEKADMLYVDEQLSQKADTTAIPDISGKADKTYVDNQLAGKAPSSTTEIATKASLYVSQSYTDEEKTTARTNIGAASSAELGEISTEITEIDGRVTALENGGGGGGGTSYSYLDCGGFHFNPQLTSMNKVQAVAKDGDVFFIYVFGVGLVAYNAATKTKKWFVSGNFGSGMNTLFVKGDYVYAAGTNVAGIKKYNKSNGTLVDTLNTNAPAAAYNNAYMFECGSLVYYMHNTTNKLYNVDLSSGTFTVCDFEDTIACACAGDDGQTLVYYTTGRVLKWIKSGVVEKTLDCSAATTLPNTFNCCMLAHCSGTYDGTTYVILRATQVAPISIARINSNGENLSNTFVSTLGITGRFVAETRNYTDTSDSLIYTGDSVIRSFNRLVYPISSYSYRYAPTNYTACVTFDGRAYLFRNTETEIIVEIK